jgi:glutaredoxin-like protein NrdH
MAKREFSLFIVCKSFCWLIAPRFIQLKSYISARALRIASENMQLSKVSGKNSKHKVLVYALSTCVWCKMTKQFLKDNDIEFEYIDVDLCDEDDKEKIRQEIQSRGGSLSYPTIIVDDNIVITGFRKDKLKEALGI